MGWTVRGSIPGRSKRYFSSPRTSRPTDIGVHPASYSKGKFLTRGKGAGHDVDHSPPSSTEVKNEYSHTSAPRV